MRLKRFSSVNTVFGVDSSDQSQVIVLYLETVNLCVTSVTLNTFLYIILTEATNKEKQVC